MVKLSTEKVNGYTSRARILINRTDPSTGERKDQPPADTTSTASQRTGIPYAFTLRKILYEDPDDNEGEIDITSPKLWDLLKAHLGHYPYHTFRGPPVTLSSPYEALVHNWEKLEKATKEEPKDDDDKETRDDLALLLRTIASSSGDPKLDKYFKMRESIKEQKSVTFETLWTLFPPGALVYGKPFQGQDQVFIVQDNIRAWPHFQYGLPREQASWSLLCWTYDWNGNMFRRLALRLEFEQFDGHKPITSLPYYPFELNEQHEAIKKNLVKQGNLYRRFCTAKQGSRMFEYRGDAIFVKKGFSGIQGDDDKVSSPTRITPLRS